MWGSSVVMNLFWVRNLGVYTIFSQTTFIAATAQKIEHQKQQQKTVSAYLLVHLLGLRNGLCWKLFVFTMVSCEFLCVPMRLWAFLCISMRLLCIRIGICRTLFVNHVRYYAFDMASNWDFVVDSSIPCVINVIALDQP